MHSFASFERRILKEVNMIKKVFEGLIKEVDTKRRIIKHIITKEIEDREGEKIIIDGIKTGAFMRNPVVLWRHGLDPIRGGLPIGRCIDLQVGKDDDGIPALFATTLFFTDEFSEMLLQMYAGGFLNAWSIGFKVLNRKNNTITESELVEYSAVPVPANPEALSNAEKIGILTKEMRKMLEFKGVIPYKKTPLADPDEEWDAAEEVKKADVEDLKMMCAWFDDENPDIKASYKLPHHKCNPPHYSCVWRGVVAAMAALFGARGGVQVPEKDRRGIYEHLAKHYEDFGKEPPEFKEYTEDELKLLFPEIYLEDLLIKAKEILDDSYLLAYKAGRVLSAKIRKKIEDTIVKLEEAIEELERLLEVSIIPEEKNLIILAAKALQEVKNEK
jgi:phage head maturation protease